MSLADAGCMTLNQKVELDSFSGHKIYPCKGRLFVRGDSKVSMSGLVRMIIT